MNFIEVLSIITKLLPVLIEVIKAVEAAIPGQGEGEKKLAAVRAILETVSDFVGGDTLNQIWPALEKVIAALVALFNKTGQFEK